MNALVDHLRKSGAVPTVRNFISLNWGLDGHYRTVRDLERAQLVEDLAMIGGLVAAGLLIDTKNEFPQESKELFDEMVGE